MRLIVVFLLGVLLASAASSAQNVPNTGEDFVSNCSKDSDTCQWYLKGFIDGHGRALRSSQVVYCLPMTGFYIDQLRRVLIKWLEDHPEKLHLGTGEIVETALKEAFPCSAQSRKK